MNRKYETLIRTLDQICEKAPDSYKSFKPQKTDISKINSARSRAFIHLYLKGVFGMNDFLEIEKHITEGGQDGGLDAYFIDEKSKRIYLIQSKFRTTERNFEAKEIDANELSKMELKRIYDGEPTSENGTPFNSKIRAFQSKIASIQDWNKYETRVVILANLKKLNVQARKRLLEGYTPEIFDFTKTYQRLILAVCAGNFYDPDEIRISINLDGREHPRIKQNINTTRGECEVTVLFVPVLQIAKILKKYQNSILRFNPRNYLSLDANEINKKIRDSIKKINANDFAVLNNGITVVADHVNYEPPHGTREFALVLTNPQIINGAQTAYSLSRILEEKDESVFEGKEVMLRIIQMEGVGTVADSFIESLSDATNQQNKISEADRRSNDPVQSKIQAEVFDQFGYFYSRKRGEFENGLRDGYLDRKLVIDRDTFIKTYVAYCGKPSEARRSSAPLFKEEAFKSLFKKGVNSREMFFAFQCHEALTKLSKSKDTKVSLKNSLKYGRMAMVCAIGVKRPKLDGDIEELVSRHVGRITSRWAKFETYAKGKKINEIYRQRNSKDIDWDNYYKGKTLNSDINTHFK